MTDFPTDFLDQPSRSRPFTLILMVLLVLLVVSALAALTVWLIKPFGTTGRATTPPLSETAYLNRATEAFAVDNFQAAADDLRRVIDRNPANTTARLLLGRAYLALHRPAEAEIEFEQFGRTNGPYNAYAILLGQALQQQGKYGRLLDRLAVTGELPAHLQAELFALRVEAQLRSGRLPLARRELDAALQQLPDTIPVQLAQARVQLAEQQPAAALATLDRVLTTAPDEAVAWSLKGEVAFRQGNLATASTAYDKAIEYRADDAGDLLNRALLRIWQGDESGAASDLAAVRRLSGDSPGWLFADGLLRWHRQDYDGAGEALAKTVELVPGYLPARFYLGLIYWGGSRWQSAETQLARYLEAVPGNRAAVLLLAGSQVYQGKFAAAEAVLTRWLKQNPQDRLALEWLAYVELAQGKTATGVERLRTLTVLSPEAATLRARLGLALLVQGDPVAAVGQFDQVAAVAKPVPEPIEWLRLLGWLRAGQYPAARRQLDKLTTVITEPGLLTTLAGLLDLQQGKTAAAQAAFSHAVQQQPGQWPATWQLIVRALAERQPALAREHLQEALTVYPDNPLLRLQLAALAEQTGASDEVRQQLAAVLRQQPGLLPVRLWLARLWLADGQPQEAIKVLQQAPANPAGRVAVQTLLGEAQLAAGDLFAATETLRELIWQQPSAQAHYLLATVHARRGESDAAQRELAKALVLDDGFLPALVSQARQALADGDLNEVQELLAKLRVRQPGHPAVFELTGKLAETEGDLRQAAAAFERGRQLYPGDQRWILWLAAVQRRAGQEQAALATYQEWLAEHPQDAVVQAALAGSYLALGREAEAMTAYTALLALQPEQPQALNALAWLLRHREPAQALAYAQRTAKQAPTAPLVQGNLALILLEQGQTRRAATLLKDILNRGVPDLSVQFYLVQALAQAGETPLSRRLLQRIVDDARDFPERPQAEAWLQTLKP